jgi:hypothetical protein
MSSLRGGKIQDEKISTNHHSAWKWANAKKRHDEQITLACAHQKMNDEKLSQKGVVAKIKNSLSIKRQYKKLENLPRTTKSS